MHRNLYFDYLAWIYGGPKWVDGMYMGIMGIMAYDMLITLASSSGVTVTIQDNKQKQLFWVKQNWWSNCDKICTVTLKAWEGKRHLLWPFWSEEQIIAEMRRPWRSVRKKWRMCQWENANHEGYPKMVVFFKWKTLIKNGCFGSTHNFGNTSYQHLYSRFFRVTFLGLKKVTSTDFLRG